MSSLHFRHFCIGVDPKFFSERKILLDIADRLEEFFLDETKKVCNLSMPPRMGKSYLLTLFSVWAFYMKYHGETKIFRVCNGAGLFQDFSKQTKGLVQNLAGVFEFEPIKGNIDSWHIGKVQQPSFFGGGFGGNITGKGGNIAIFDDMYRSYPDAISAAYDRELNYFLQSAVRSRMEGDDYKIINVGTRWAVNDWFSKFSVDMEIILPALGEDGETCCKAYKSTNELHALKRDLEPYIWEAQFMQRPTLQGRQLLFKESDINLIDVLPQFESEAVIIDPSQMTGNDNFVCGHYGKLKGQLYLIDMFAENLMELDDVYSFLKEKNCGNMFIETNGLGLQIYNKLQNAGFDVQGFPTFQDKYSRAWDKLENIRNYTHIYGGLKHLHILTEQFVKFPTAAHDDLVDNVIMAWERFDWF